MTDNTDLPLDGEPDDLLGAYALDAVDAVERGWVEARLAVDPRARDEVQAYREVAALLAFSGSEAPDGVWDRIAAALDGRPPRPGPALARVLPPEPSRRSRRSALVAAGAAALVAAVLAVVITVAVTDDDISGTTTQSAIEQAFGEAQADPTARRAALASSDDELHAEAVLQVDGHGFVSAADLPELPDDETYQLWGVFDDSDVISLGVIGNRPQIEPFTATGGVDALVITRERAGGVQASTSGALLAGELT